MFLPRGRLDPERVPLPLLSEAVCISEAACAHLRHTASRRPFAAASHRRRPLAQYDLGNFRNGEHEPPSGDLYDASENLCRMGTPLLISKSQLPAASKDGITNTCCHWSFYAVHHMVDGCKHRCVGPLNTAFYRVLC